MRIRRQSRRLAQLVTKIFHLCLAEPSLKKCSGVYARRSVPLKVNEIARLIAIGGVKKVIEAYLEQRRQRRVSRTLAADPPAFLILAMHHAHSVPAAQSLEAPFARD